MNPTCNERGAGEEQLVGTADEQETAHKVLQTGRNG